MGAAEAAGEMVEEEEEVAEWAAAGAARAADTVVSALPPGLPFEWPSLRSLCCRDDGARAVAPAAPPRALFPLPVLPRSFSCVCILSSSPVLVPSFPDSFFRFAGTSCGSSHRFLVPGFRSLMEIRSAFRSSRSSASSSLEDCSELLSCSPSVPFSSAASLGSDLGSFRCLALPCADRTLVAVGPG
jgi:hypothetical protein